MMWVATAPLVEKTPGLDDTRLQLLLGICRERPKALAACSKSGSFRADIEPAVVRATGACAQRELDIPKVVSFWTAFASFEVGCPRDEFDKRLRAPLGALSYFGQDLRRATPRRRLPAREVCH